MTTSETTAPFVEMPTTREEHARTLRLLAERLSCEQARGPITLHTQYGDLLLSVAGPTRFGLHAELSGLLRVEEGEYAIRGWERCPHVVDQGTGRCVPAGGYPCTEIGEAVDAACWATPTAHKLRTLLAAHAAVGTALSTAEISEWQTRVPLLRLAAADLPPEAGKLARNWLDRENPTCSVEEFTAACLQLADYR